VGKAVLSKTPSVQLPQSKELVCGVREDFDYLSFVGQQDRLKELPLSAGERFSVFNVVAPAPTMDAQFQTCVCGVNSTFPVVHPSPLVG
jgi:hypothetical protein